MKSCPCFAEARNPERHCLALPFRAPCQAATTATEMRYAIAVADGQERTGSGAQVQERVKPKSEEPTRYRVVLLNDNYTTMEFVIVVLEDVFRKSPAEAYQIMMQVHLQGRGIAGVYPWEEAETKVETVQSLARQAGFPLRAALEEE